MMRAATENSMTAEIIPLSRAQNPEMLTPLRPPLYARWPASLAGAGRLWWHRARLSVEVVGWIVVAASVIQALR
jgi:hypothetical protein